MKRHSLLCVWARPLMMCLLVFSTGFVSEASGLPAPAQTVGPCMPCEELVHLRFPEVRIDSALRVEGKADSSTKGYCQVSGVIGKEISFELLLPDTWNKRFVMGGGGGFVGYVMNRARNSVDDGFATVGTDTGHKGINARWGLYNVERQLNFGHLAVHRTAETSRAIIYRYYGTDPAYAYFIGLSRGGGQAMMEAQRYPGDFDGIVAGAPAFDWTGMAAEFIQNSRAVYPDPSRSNIPVITRDNLKLLQRTILEECDALDGVRDSILNDPRECKFDLAGIPRCKGKPGGANCLTDAQRAAIQTIYHGTGTDGDRMHPGFGYGGEDEKTGWFPSIVGPNKGAAPYFTWQAFYGMETMRYLVLNDSAWTSSNYDLAMLRNDTRYASSYLDATQTDYHAFKARGGKMIIYQGWIDPLISAMDIIDHYEEALSKDAQLPEYIRLYMLPGVTHTGGNGPGKADWFQLIQDWVEKDIAPGRVLVSKNEKGKTVMSRPVYPYPRNARYKGTGDPNVEGSFD